MPLPTFIIIIVRPAGRRQMLPKYAPLFVPVLFRAVRDADEVVRASALSTLATVCQLLRFGVGHFLQELLACLVAVIGSDPEPQVRTPPAYLIGDWHARLNAQHV